MDTCNLRGQELSMYLHKAQANNGSKVETCNNCSNINLCDESMQGG
jgi:hypothetical protein